MEKKYILRLVIIMILIIIGGVFYYLFSPAENDFFPQCTFHKMTGLDCPGCGSQRAIHHLLHLRIKESFFSNPLLVIAIPYVLLCLYLEYFGGKESFPRLRKALYSKISVWGILIVILLFWIIRNLV